MRTNKSGIDWSDREQRLEYHRRWRAKNPKRNRKLQREYQMNNPEKHREFQRKYARSNPKIIKTHNLVNNHKLPLGSKCVFCDRTEKLEHGHIDYDYPEIYLTVCHECNSWMGVD